MKLPAGIHAFLPRFLAGTAGSVLVGLVFYQEAVFDLENPASQCVRMGALAAAILALFRSSRPDWAVMLVAAVGLFQLGLLRSSEPFRAAALVFWSVFMAFGFCIIAVIFNHLARANLRFGKFLIVGPLMGGLYLAATPLAVAAAGRSFEILYPLLTNSFLGIVIGDGVGLGIEVVELFSRPQGRNTSLHGETAKPAIPEATSEGDVP